MLVDNKHRALDRYIGLLMAVTASVIALGPLSGCAGSKGGQATAASTTSPASARGGVTPSGTPATTSSSSSSASPGAATSAPASEHPQFKFTGMPKHCPSPDEITLALRVSIPKVSEQTVGNALNCTYYVDGGTISPGVNITFGDADTSNPAAATAAWKANLKAFPSAVMVQGIGDGAVYYIAKGGATAFNFISNGITCNMYTGNFKADQAHMATLAEFILKG